MKLTFLIIAIILFVFAAFGFNPIAAVSTAWLGMAFFAAFFLPIVG